MRLTEAKLRQIVREELIRDHKKKLREADVAGQHRRAAAEELGGTGEQGADSGTPMQVARAARQQRADIIADIRRQFSEGEIDKDTRDELIKMTRDKTKLQIDQYRAQFRAAVLRSKEAAKQVVIDANEEEIQRLVDAGAPQRTAEDSVVVAALAQLEAEESEAEDSAAASVDIPTSTLRSGKKGPDVETAQKWLTQAGFEVEVDGQFGGETKLAVTSFQDQEGLKQDGVIGKNTWAALARKQGGGGGEVEVEAEESETEDAAGGIAENVTRRRLRRLISRELRRL